jgi:O-antigen/teichoic acid export membrane protein
MSLHQRIREAIAALAVRVGPTFIVNLIIAAVGIGTGIILARVLGPALRGDAAASVQWATFALLLGDFGIGFALAYFVGAEPLRERELWGFSILLAGIWGSVLMVLAMMFVPPFAQPGAQGAIRLALVAIPAGLLAGYQGYLLLGVGRVREYNISRLAGTIAYAVVVGTAVPMVRSASAVATALVASHLVSAAGSAMFLRTRGPPGWGVEGRSREASCDSPRRRRSHPSRATRRCAWTSWCSACSLSLPTWGSMPSP